MVIRSHDHDSQWGNIEALKSLATHRRLIEHPENYLLKRVSSHQVYLENFFLSGSAQYSIQSL